MPIGRVTVHEAIPVVSGEEGEYVEGSKEIVPREGTAFDVLLQLPTGGDEDRQPRGRRTITRPQIIYEPFDQDGNDLHLDAEDEVKILAEELTGPDFVLWQVEGRPTPLAKPGFAVGFLARLKRVDD